MHQDRVSSTLRTRARDRAIGASRSVLDMASRYLNGLGRQIRPAARAGGGAGPSLEILVDPAFEHAACCAPGIAGEVSITHVHALFSGTDADGSSKPVENVGASSGATAVDAALVATVLARPSPASKPAQRRFCAPVDSYRIRARASPMRWPVSSRVYGGERALADGRVGIGWRCPAKKPTATWPMPSRSRPWPRSCWIEVEERDR